MYKYLTYVVPNHYWSKHLLDVCAKQSLDRSEKMVLGVKNWESKIGESCTCPFRPRKSAFFHLYYFYDNAMKIPSLFLFIYLSQYSYAVEFVEHVLYDRAIEKNKCPRL